MKSGAVGRLETALPFDDVYGAEDGPEASRHQKSEDPTFYLTLCLDMLIVLVVVNSVKRFRNGDHLSSADPVQKGQFAEKLQDVIQELHSAVRTGDTASCALLLDQRRCRAILAGEDIWGCTALHVAADEGLAEKVVLLLERHAPVDALDAWDQTPLHFAARSGSTAICDLLLSHGAALNAVDADNRTPLHTAALLGHECVCELLLDRGACLENVADVDVPPLLTALLFQRMLRGPPRRIDEA